MNQRLSTIIQWGAIVLLILFLVFKPKFPDVNLSWAQIIVLSLSISFTWVKILKWGTRKPFNCMKCMSGWAALLIGYMSFGWPGLAFVFIGVFFGSLFEAITFRWL